MYKCKHFGIKELVSKKVYEDRGTKAWGLLDERALKTLDALRDRFGSTTVNDWSWGGANQYRGFREDGCGVGAEYSQHKYGRAKDCTFRDVSAEVVRQYILDNPDEFPYISSIEMGVSWLHFGVGNHGPGIITFYP